MILVSAGVYYYYNSDKVKIIGTWVSDENEDISYTFKKNGEFVYDSAGIEKEGKYELNNDKKKKLN